MATGEQGKRAKDDAAAFAELKARLDEAKGALKGLQDEANKDVFAKDPIKKARAEVQELTAAYRELAKAQKEAAAEEKKESKRKAAIEKATGAGDPLENAFKDGEWHATAIEGALAKGGEALAAGAKLAVGAAVAIGAAGVALVKSGVEFGIRSTADKDKQVQILDRLTHGQGRLAEEVSQGLAEQTGVSEEKTLERVKSLIGAKFGRGDTEAITRAAADIGEVKGEGSGEAFISLLEKTKELGVASEKSIKALASVGIEKSELYEGLKKTGETTAELEARLKAGKVTADEFTKAATAAASKDFGGVAGRSLDAQLNRIKIGLGDLFEDWDLEPLEELGEKLEEVLKSDDAKALQKGIADVGKSVIDLAKGVSKEDIASFFKTAASAAHELADDIRDAAHGVSVLVAALKSAKSGSYTALDEALASEEKKAPEPAAKPGYRGRTTTEHVGGDEVVTVGGANSAEDEARVKASRTGKAYGEGLAAGVDASAADAAAAGARAGDAVDKGARGALGVHSPSTVAEEVGGFYDKGLERGIDRYADGPENAAARLAGRVSRAGVPTAGVGGAGASGGLGVGAVSITWAPTYQLQVGAPADIAATLREHDAAAYPKLLAQVRQIVRDARETGGPP